MGFLSDIALFYVDFVQILESFSLFSVGSDTINLRQKSCRGGTFAKVNDLIGQSVNYHDNSRSRDSISPADRSENNNKRKFGQRRKCVLEKELNSKFPIFNQHKNGFINDRLAKFMQQEREFSSVCIFTAERYS